MLKSDLSRVVQAVLLTVMSIRAAYIPMARGALFLALGVAVGRAITLSAGASVGAWLRNLAPAAVIAILLLIWVFNGPTLFAPSRQTVPLTRRDLVIGLVGLLALGPLAVILAMWAPGVTYLLSFAISAAGILVAVVLIIDGKFAPGLAVFILVMPLVSFLEFDFFRNLFWDISVQGIFFITPTVLLLWFMGFAALLHHLVNNNRFVFALPMARVLAVLLLGTLVSTAFSADPIAGVRHATYLLTVSVPYFIALNGIKSTKALKLTCLALGLAGVIRVFSILYFQVFQTSQGLAGRVSYFGGYTVIQGLIWGTTFGFMMLFGVAFCTDSKRLRLSLLALGTATLAAGFATLSRVTVIAIALGAFVFVLPRRSRFTMLGGVALTALAISVWWPIVADKTALRRFQEFSSVESVVSGQRQRLEGGRLAMLTIRDRPLVGAGPAMWEEYTRRFSPEPFYYTDETGFTNPVYVTGSHSPFLDAWAATGLIGLLGQILLYIIIVRQSIRLYRKQREGPLAVLAMAFVAFTISITLNAIFLGGNVTLFNPNLFVEAHLVLWLGFGLLDAWGNLQEEKAPTTSFAASPARLASSA